MPLFDFTKPAPDFSALAADLASRGVNDKPDRTGGASLDLPALVDRYANKYGLPPEWGMAKLHVESGFNPKARAKTSSATGLTQVLDAARRDYNKAHGKNLTREDLMDPETSLDAGFWYWAKMPGNTPFEKSMAYFAGPNQRDPKVLKEAAVYARKIERLAAQYSKRTGRRVQPQRKPDFSALAAKLANGASTPVPPAPSEELGFPSAAFTDAIPDFSGVAARLAGSAAPEAATGATQTGTAPPQVPVPGMAPHVQKEMDRSLGSIKTITGMVPRVLNAPVNVPRHGIMTPEQFRIGLKNGEFQLTKPEINKVLNEIGGVDPETLEYAVKNEVQTMRNLGGANALSQKTGLPVDTSEIKPPLEEDSILPGSFQKILWALGTPQSALVAPINRLLQGGATAKDLQDEFLSPFRGEKLTSWRSVLDTLFPDETWGTLDPNAFFDDPKTKKLKEAGYLPASPLSFTGKGFAALLMDAIFDPLNLVGVGPARNSIRLSDGLVLSGKGKEQLVKGIRTIMDAAPKDLDEAGRAAHQFMARRLAEDSLKLAVDAGDNTLVAKGGVRIAGLQVPLTAEAANLTKEIVKKGAQQVRKSPQGRFVADEANKFISKFERDWLVKAKVYRDYVKDKHGYFNFIKANRQELLDRAQVVFAPLKKWEREAVTDAVEAGAIDNPVWVTLGERYADGPTGAPMYRTREIVPTDEMRKAAKAVAQDQLNWRNVENSLGIGGGFLENYMMRRWKNYPAVREAAQARFGTWMRANQHKPLADLTTLEMMDLVPELEPATRDAMELYLMRGMSSIRAQSAYHFIAGTLMKYGKDFNRTGDWFEDMRFALQNGYKAPPRVVTLGREYEIAAGNPMFDRDGNPIMPQGTMPAPSGAAPKWSPDGPVQNPPGGPSGGGPAQPPPAPPSGPSGAAPVSDATPPDPPAPPRGFEPSDPSSAPPPPPPPPPPAPVPVPSGGGPLPLAPAGGAAAAPPPAPAAPRPPAPPPPPPPVPAPVGGGPPPLAPAGGAAAPIAMLPDQIAAELKKKAVERTGIEGVADKIIEGKSPEELAQMLGDFDKTPMPQWLAEAVMDDAPAVPPAPPVAVSPQVQQVVAKEYKKYEGLRLANQDILPSMRDRYWRVPDRKHIGKWSHDTSVVGADEGVGPSKLWAENGREYENLGNGRHVFVRKMRPSEFLEVNPYRLLSARDGYYDIPKFKGDVPAGEKQRVLGEIKTAPSGHITELLRQGKSFAPPRLQVKWVKDKDGNTGWKVVGHEGRGRTLNYLRLFGDEPIEVHLTALAKDNMGDFGVSGPRSLPGADRKEDFALKEIRRDLTPKQLAAPLIPEWRRILKNRTPSERPGIEWGIELQNEWLKDKKAFWGGADKDFDRFRPEHAKNRMLALRERGEPINVGNGPVDLPPRDEEMVRRSMEFYGGKSPATEALDMNYKGILGEMSGRPADAIPEGPAGQNLTEKYRAILKQQKEAVNQPVVKPGDVASAKEAAKQAAASAPAPAAAPTAQTLAEGAMVRMNRNEGIVLSTEASKGLVKVRWNNGKVVDVPKKSLAVISEDEARTFPFGHPMAGRKKSEALIRAEKGLPVLRGKKKLQAQAAAAADLPKPATPTVAKGQTKYFNGKPVKIDEVMENGAFAIDQNGDRAFYPFAALKDDLVPVSNQPVPGKITLLPDKSPGTLEAEASAANREQVNSIIKSNASTAIDQMHEYSSPYSAYWAYAQNAFDTVQEEKLNFSSDIERRFAEAFAKEAGLDPKLVLKNDVDEQAFNALFKRAASEPSANAPTRLFNQVPGIQSAAGVWEVDNRGLSRIYSLTDEKYGGTWKIEFNPNTNFHELKDPAGNVVYDNPILANVWDKADEVLADQLEAPPIRPTGLAVGAAVRRGGKDGKVLSMEDDGLVKVEWADGRVTKVQAHELQPKGPGSPGGNAPLPGPLGRRGPLRAPKDDYASAVASGSNPKILAAAAKKADDEAASPVFNQAAKGRNLSDLTLEDLMAERAALQGEGYANDFGDPFGPGKDLEDEIIGPGREAMRNENLKPQEVPPVGIPKHITPENMPGWGPGENGPVNPNMPNEIDNYKKMLKWMVPGPIADDMLTVADPAEASSLWRGFDRVTGAIKTSMTIPFPAFHIRNAMGNIANAFLDIGIQALNPRRHMMAIDVLRGNKAGKMLTETGEEFTYQYLRQRFRQEGLEGAFHGRLDIIQTPEGQILGAKAPPFWRSLGRAITGKDSIRNVHPIQRMGQAVGENLEEEARMHLFLTYIRRGDSIDEAARRVKQVLFDYDHLTPFEKRWMRRAIPFYTWTRKNIPYQMRKVLEEPGRYQALAEIYTQYGDRDQIEQQLRMFPPYMSHQLGRQIGYDTVGNPLFAVGFGIPIEDLQRLFPQIRSSESRTGEFMRMNVLAMLHPFFRAVIEEAANKDMYLDRPLDELNTMYDIWGKAAKQMPEFIQKSIGFKEETNARGDVVYKMDPRKLHIVRSFILSRIYSTVGKAFDERKDWGTRALNTLTGMTITSVDWETQILPAIRNRTWERKEASEHQFKQQVRAFRFRDPVNPFAGESVSANELIGKPDPLPAKKVVAQTPDVTNALQRGQLKAADLAETARQGAGR